MFQFVVIHTVKGFSVVNEAEVDVFLEFRGFLPPRHAHGDLTSLAPHERLPEILVEKAREFQKNIYFCFIDYTKAFDCVDHSKLENS